MMLGSRATDGATVRCPTFSQAAGSCTPTEMLSWNPLMDRKEGHGVSNPELGPASPFRDGSRQKYGLSVTGGGDMATYFLSGEFDEEQGRRRIAVAGVRLEDEHALRADELVVRAHRQVEVLEREVEGIAERKHDHERDREQQAFLGDQAR